MEQPARKRGRPRKRDRKASSASVSTAAAVGATAAETAAAAAESEGRVLQRCTDAFGRTMYLVERNGCEQPAAWVPADALPLPAALEFESAPFADGRSARCANPACAAPPAKGSKYCSDACGMAVARARVAARCTQRSAPGGDAAAIEAALRPASVADAVDAGAKAEAAGPAFRAWEAATVAAVAEAEARCETARRREAAIAAELQRLDAFVLAAGPASALATAAALEEPSPQRAVEHLDCPSCGKPLATRQQRTAAAGDHMYACYARFEHAINRLNSSVLSPVPITQPYARIAFCCRPCGGGTASDHSAHHYCRRLRASCPFHGGPLSATAAAAARASTLGMDVACGFPRRVTADGEFADPCQVSRARCEAHANWEALWRASLEQARASARIDVDVAQFELADIRGILALSRARHGIPTQL